MKILQSLCLGSILLCSTSLFAVPATDQQVEQILKIEQWDQLKKAIIQNGLPNLKSMIESSFISSSQIPQPISADQQVLIKQISDIMVNDSINQIDETKLLNNVRKAYKNLTQEQAQAYIEFYQKDGMQLAGRKAPQIIVYGLNSGTDSLSDILNSPEIKKAIQMSKSQ